MYKNRGPDGRNNLCGRKVARLRIAREPRLSQRGLADLLQLENLDVDKNAVQRIESGQEYFSYQLYSSVATAGRLRRSIRSLHREQVSTYGVAVVPLKDCEQTPDVVIVMTNAYQSMRMVQGYEYGTGKKPAIDMGAMQGMCSELTISPYLTGEMNVSVLCPSTRMLCKWSENDMAVGIPYELFEQIVEGVEATQPNY